MQLWNRQGTFLYTGSAGIYAADDGSEVSEQSATAPLGKDERTDRSHRLDQHSKSQYLLNMSHGTVEGNAHAY